MPALVTWLCYHLGLYVVWPAVYRRVYDRWPFAYPRVDSMLFIDVFLALVLFGYLFWLAVGFRELAPVSVPVGIGVVGIAAALRVWALATLGSNFRLGQDASDRTVTYVRRGPYRFLRNPINLGLVVAAVGQALLTGFDGRAGMLLGGTLIYYAATAVIEGRRWRRNEGA